MHPRLLVVLAVTLIAAAPLASASETNESATAPSALPLDVWIDAPVVALAAGGTASASVVVTNPGSTSVHVELAGTSSSALLEVEPSSSSITLEPGETLHIALKLRALDGLNDTSEIVSLEATSVNATNASAVLGGATTKVRIAPGGPARHAAPPREPPAFAHEVLVTEAVAAVVVTHPTAAAA